MPEVTQKQHYVPQFYLKQFADKDGHLYFYSKLNGKIFRSVPREICYKNNMYETTWENASEKLGKYVLQNSIEKSYSRKEADFASLLSKLLGKCTAVQKRTAIICNGNDKKLLTEFAANLFVRHPCTINAFQLDQIQDDVRENPIIQAGQGLFSALELGSMDSLILDAQKKSFMTDEYDGGFCVDMAKRLCNVDLTFFYSADSAFVTSSFPSAAMEDSSAVGSEKISAYLPLSPRVAVLFGNFARFHNSRNRIVDLSKDDVMKFNKNYLRFSTEQVQFIISHSESLLNELIQSKESET